MADLDLSKAKALGESSAAPAPLSPPAGGGETTKDVSAAFLPKYGVEVKDYAAHIFRDVLIYRRRPPPALASVRKGDRDFWQLIGVVSGMSPQAAAEFKADLEAIEDVQRMEG